MTGRMFSLAARGPVNYALAECPDGYCPDCEHELDDCVCEPRCEHRWTPFPDSPHAWCRRTVQCAKDEGHAGPHSAATTNPTRGYGAVIVTD